jgi:hypothetical protein
MKKHLPWIVVIVATVLILAGLHFFVFAPLNTKYEQVNADMKTSIQGLSNKISSVQWIGETPDPRKPSFSWNKLQTEIQQTFENRLVDYEKLAETIDVGMPSFEGQDTIALVLERLAKLQEIEAQSPGMRILEKWGLDMTTTSGYNGTRPLNLTEGGFRSYTTEDRLDSTQGTVQFAVDLAPWYITDPAVLAQQTSGRGGPVAQQMVLFHAAKHKMREPDSPANVHPGFSSEITIYRDGTDLVASIRKMPDKPVPGMAGGQPLEMQKRTSLLPYLTDTSSPQQWKLIRLTWGPQFQNFQLYIDNQSADTINAQFNPRAGGQAYGAGAGAYGGGAYGGGAGAYGGGVYGGGTYGADEGMSTLGGGAEYYGATRGQQAPPAVVVDPLDSFVIGANLKTENEASLKYDALKIWNAIGDTNEPTARPLFQEDFEHPFGSPENLDLALRQLIRYHENLYDPLMSADVKSLYQTLYSIQLGFAGLVTPRGEFVDALRRIAFMNYAIQHGPVRGDMDRLSRQISFPIPEAWMRDTLIIFMDLTLDLMEAMVKADVDVIAEVIFLNFSTTITDEAIKQAFQEAHEALKLDIAAGQGGGMGMGMGMMPGMGMGMMPGMGMPGMYGGGAMPYGSEYGGMDPYGGGGMYGEDAPREGEDPEQVKERMAKREEERKKAQEQYAEMLEKMEKLKENQEKLARWNNYISSGDIAPDYYKEYRESQTEAGKDFFLRYSLRSTFYCAKDKIAEAFYNIEYGDRLAFISQVALEPAGWGEDLLSVTSQVEYCFMKKVEIDGAAGAVDGATATQQAAADIPGLAPTGF